MGDVTKINRGYLTSAERRSLKETRRTVFFATIAFLALTILGTVAAAYFFKKASSFAYQSQLYRTYTIVASGAATISVVFLLLTTAGSCRFSDLHGELAKDKRLSAQIIISYP